MASIHRDPDSKRYRIRFRLRGQEFNRSIKTKSRREAEATLSRVEEIINLIERGRLEIPEDVEPGKFILTDGKNVASKNVSQIRNIKALFKKYEQSQFYMSKEESTRKTERFHLRHLRRLLNTAASLNMVKVATLQAYVDKRLSEQYRGRLILPDTARNEIVTFRLIWNWAVQQELVAIACPTKGLVFPNRDEKPPFMTRREIERKIARGGLSDKQLAELWESLYLATDEIDAILGIAIKNGREPFFYPMLLMAAHTGARRSELLRSEIDDFDFEANMIHVREKKKSRTKAITFRAVPMSSSLKKVLIAWLKKHPGGQMMFVHRDGRIVSPDSAVYHFTQAFTNTEWDVLRGYHVFRHSFCSNCASRGVDQRLINEWVGHQTEEMVKRYRHLFPDQQHQALNIVFG